MATQRPAAPTMGMTGKVGLKVTIDDLPLQVCDKLCFECDGLEYQITIGMPGYIMVRAIQSSLLIRPIAANQIMCTQG